MNKSAAYIRFIPLTGIIIFITLYIVAALLYPGGHYLDLHSKGFSIVHNYWCDLTNTIAQNGETNPSSPVAISAMLLLCLSMIIFWYKIPEIFTISPYHKLIMRSTGIASMLIGMLIFTEFHHEALIYSGAFGGVAFLALIVGLYQTKWYSMLYFGIFCLVIGAITFAIYISRQGIIILPMIQKVTLAACLLWVVTLDRQMRK